MVCISNPQAATLPRAHCIYVYFCYVCISKQAYMHLRQLTLLVRNKKKKKERIPTFSPWIMIIMKVIISGIKKNPSGKTHSDDNITIKA